MLSKLSPNFTHSLITACALAMAAGAFAASGPQAVPTALPEASVRNVASLAVPFVANGGEADADVAFYARTFAGTVFVTREARLVYSLPARRTAGQAPQAASTVGWTLAESFPSAVAPRAPAGGARSAAQVSRFGPGTDRGRSSLTFDDIVLGEVAPGIDARVRATGNNVEKLFFVAPGADASNLRARIDGADGVEVAADGSLSVRTGLGTVQFTPPVAWQMREGLRIPVEVRYAVTGASEYGFRLGLHDPELEVVIDPLIRSTYAGGGAVDSIRAMTVHPGTGTVYVAGFTASTDFPKTTGAQTTNPTNTQEAVVAHFAPGLNSLVRATYYGGDGADIATAIAIHPTSGDVYIAGTTTSSTGTLAGTTTPYSGTPDGFIARFDGALSSVLGARYYGGNGSDNIAALVIDRISGEVVVAGATTSDNLPLGSGTPAQPANAGGADAFVARLSASLDVVIRATYFGSAGNDRALSMAMDTVTGDLIIGGSTTTQSPLLLPASLNGAQPTNAGATDGFVARLDGTLGTVRMSTFLGGNGIDEITSVGVHPISGEIYATGSTGSANVGGPIGAQAASGGGTDAFVARFHSDLTGLRTFTYFGKGGDEFANALAISRYNGEIYVTGFSSSPTLPSSAVDGPQPVNAGGFDAFIARFDAALSGVRQSTFFGGTGNDVGYAIALTDTAAFIAGETSSPSSPTPTLPGTANAAYASLSGLSDGFIATWTTDLVAGNSNPLPFSFVPIINALPGTLQVSAPTQVIPAGNALAYADGQPGSTWCASSAANCTCDKTGNVFVTGEALISVLTPGTPYYVCARHVSSAAPDAVTESRLHIGGVTGVFRVATGGGAGVVGCSLDIDGNGAQDALTDGLLVIRALFGLTGTAVTNNAIGSNASRSTWTDIRAYLNSTCGAKIP